VRLWVREALVSAETLAGTLSQQEAWVTHLQRTCYWVCLLLVSMLNLKLFKLHSVVTGS
jgi:hypothetical protein